MSYTFLKNYKSIDMKRLSFNALAISTFGINFEPWYQQGFWSDSYQTYTYFDHETAISNVSYNVMSIIMNDITIPAIQIGTVMTHKNYRKQGLAKNLLERVISDLENDYEIFFLAADELAMPLYKSCGFVPVIESRFSINVSGEKMTLQQKNITPSELIQRKQNSKPVSQKLSCVDDTHVLMFYFMLGFNHMIYEPIKDVLVIYTIEEKVLTLYDIITSLNISHQTVVDALCFSEVDRIHFMFTPDDSIVNPVISIYEDNHWMIRSKKIRFPDHSMFPSISQT